MAKVKKPAGYIRTARKISYGGKRDLKDIIAVVIHYTGNKGDTAKNNADYFATSNTRAAGAHIFVDRKGNIAYSIPIGTTAYAVGSRYSTSNGAGAYYGRITNANSVSIELCDCATKDPSWEQMIACRKLYLWLKSECPNIKHVVRHWDVNGKNCPARLAGKNNKKWEHLFNKITKNYQFRVKVTKDATIRSSKGVRKGNKTGTVKKGAILNVSKVVGSWYRLLEKDSKGKYRWVTKVKVKEI